jgi:hypothetical protein
VRRYLSACKVVHLTKPSVLIPLMGTDLETRERTHVPDGFWRGVAAQLRLTAEQREDVRAMDALYKAQIGGWVRQACCMRSAHAYECKSALSMHARVHAAWGPPMRWLMQGVGVRDKGGLLQISWGLLRRRRVNRALRSHAAANAPQGDGGAGPVAGPAGRHGG